MLNLVAADLIILLHSTLIIFVVIFGLFVLKWWWSVWIHILCVLWGAIIEFSGLICPLTPIENMLRYSGEKGGYTHSFIEEYFFPLIYPAALTRELQILMGVVVIVINVVVYIALYFLYAHEKSKL